MIINENRIFLLARKKINKVVVHILKSRSHLLSLFLLSVRCSDIFLFSFDQESDWQEEEHKSKHGFLMNYLVYASDRGF